MIDVDEIEAGGALADLYFALTGIADFHLFPLEDFGPSRFMDLDCVSHGRASTPSTRKEKPRGGGPEPARR